MAREHVLDNPVVVKKEGVETEYPVVRLLNPISIRVVDGHDRQSIVVQWAVGKIDADGNFVPLSGEGLSGSKVYDNQGVNASFDQLIASSNGLGAFMDNIFADLEAAGAFGPGTQRDYALPS